jgi:protein-tyrosine phosphatase
MMRCRFTSKVESLALVGLLLVGGCAAALPIPPPPPGISLRRFDRVDGDVLRASQPNAHEMARLVERYGVRTVLKLNFGHEHVPDGVQVIYAPINPLREPTHDELERILEAIDRAPKPLVIHCTHGEDRTGLIVALYRMRHGASVELAYTDMVRHGFHPYEGLWAAWVRWVGWR